MMVGKSRLGHFSFTPRSGLIVSNQREIYFGFIYRPQTYVKILLFYLGCIIILPVGGELLSLNKELEFMYVKNIFIGIFE